MFRAEDRSALPTARPRWPLQWGRSCSERKTTRSHRCAPSADRASMGPLLFRAEDWARVPGGEWVPTGFNGAALVQSGRRVRMSGRSAAQFGASMGPLLFRAEDARRPQAPGSGAPAASMGPLLFRAEDTLCGPELGRAIRTASMGPLLFRAEDLCCGGWLEMLRRLQWGRSCSERKTQSRPHSISMQELLQWGRSCSERKTSTIR